MLLATKENCFLNDHDSIYEYAINLTLGIAFGNIANVTEYIHDT